MEKRIIRRNPYLMQIRYFHMLLQVQPVELSVYDAANAIKATNMVNSAEWTVQMANLL